MKTPIQNLYENILNQPELQNIPMDTINVITHLFAKAMDEEKQQIIDAVNFTEHTGGYSGEEYYSDTFTTNKETLK